MDNKMLKLNIEPHNFKFNPIYLYCEWFKIEITNFS